ncbi:MULTISPECIES: tachylectin-related carbohydrate-binding protein [Amycolatopsis]|uniref:Tachylectin-related carbohydrate-binding protein n=1 Tax=Amycolatopsis albidoflavus TaxID=102226 RepID=A0ABW5HWP2_9PSEU
MRVVARLLAIGLLAGTTATTGAPHALAADSAQLPLAEDYAYPGADQIFADRGLRLYRGDGRITLVDCPTKGSADDKVIRAKSTSQGEYCFKVSAPNGYLSLELPETFKIRGDGDHTVEAKVSTKGKEETVAVNKTRDTPVGEGISYENGPAVLLELKATGAAPAPTGQNTSTAPIAKIAVGAPGYPGSRACTGTLVAAQWIATAASCFADDPATSSTVAAGAPKQKTTATLGRASLAETDKGQVLDVTSLIPRNDRDLVLAKLSAPAAGITPVSLATSPAASGESLNVAGYGRTATEWTPDLVHGTAATATTATDTVLAVTPTGDIATPCKGDAGGPVYRDLGNNRFELVAITSTGSQQGCHGASPATTRNAAAARIDNVGDWIRQNVPDLAIVCKPAAPIFTTRGDGTLWLYQHTDPRNGAFSWINGNGQQIGSGWQSARSTAGPDGLVYQANSNGQLRKFRWNGTGWDLNTSPTPYYEVIDNGWARYATAEYNNRITVDTRGHIYTVEPDGNLHWRNYDPAAKKWDHRVLGNGWGQYDLIAAAGDGVLYARTPKGELFRYAYDSSTGEWTQKAKPSGTGWNGFKTVTSPGADVLYGSYPAEGGGLLWYRYLPASDTWSDTGRANGKLIGTGWYGLYGMTATPDSCRLAR